MPNYVGPYVTVYESPHHCDGLDSSLRNRPRKRCSALEIAIWHLPPPTLPSPPWPEMARYDNMTHSLMPYDRRHVVLATERTPCRPVKAQVRNYVERARAYLLAVPFPTHFMLSVSLQVMSSQAFCPFSIADISSFFPRRFVFPLEISLSSCAAEAGGDHRPIR